jgi:hypothetical protein
MPHDSSQNTINFCANKMTSKVAIEMLNLQEL